MNNVITSTTELEKFCTSLAYEKFVTVDTEFMREKTYYPLLCLIQIAGEKHSAIIDPLAPGIDLKSLNVLFSNPAVLKVFHACRQDIEIFYQAFGTIPAPVFDTQVAAMVCGYGEAASYESLTNKILGIAVDKSSRFTDWSRRPLSEKQLSYAINDVLHLREIYEALEKNLARSGRREWINEEMQALLDQNAYNVDPNDVWKRLRFRNMSPRYLASLQAVARWRELTARERNVPRGRIMKDETLTEVANAKPADFSELQAIRGFHPTMSATNYEPLFTMLKEVDLLPPSSYPHLPVKPQISTESESIADLLRLLLKNCAGKNQIVPRLIADKDDLELMACGKRDHIKALHGWRHEVFGAQAAKLLDGKIAIKTDGHNGIKFIEMEQPGQAAAG